MSTRPVHFAVFLVFGFAFPVSLWGQGEAEANRPAAAIADLLRYEPTGLSLLHPYARGKIPILFVHGLWSNPWSWSRMIGALEADPSLKDRYQYWTFGYSTGDPIPYTATLLRHNLEEVRRKCDPDHSDPALTRMVIVGHSMGGLLAKMMVVEPESRLWHVISDRSFGELRGAAADRELFRSALIFHARSGFRRVVFIATPHQGSRVDHGSLQHLGTRLVRLPDPLRAAHDRLVSQNDRAFFKEYFRKGLPTSIDELEWGSPILTGLYHLRVTPAVEVHSIIAARPGATGTDPSDGLVSYTSAHIAEAKSEKIVSAGHLCQDHPDVISEVRRILLEQAAR